MTSFQVSNSVKALFLGFFCCLGVAPAQDGDPKKALNAENKDRK